jgi:surface protein
VQTEDELTDPAAQINLLPSRVPGFEVCVGGKGKYQFLREEFGIPFWQFSRGNMVYGDVDANLVCPTGANNRGVWRVGGVYAQCDSVQHGGVVYYAKQANTGDAANRPGDGTGRWEDNWVPITKAPMLFTIVTTAPGTAFDLPTNSAGTYDVTIDWGDGTPIQTANAWNHANMRHTYAAAGSYQIKLSGRFSIFDYYSNATVRSSVLFVKSVEQWGDIGVVSFENGFRGATNLMRVDARDNLANVTDFSVMFSGCSKLTSLDVSRFNTSAATTLSGMFSGCSGLTSLDVSGFDTSAANNLGYMFSDCTGLTSLDVTRFDTSAANNLSGMFSNCSKLTSIDVTKFDTSAANNLGSMFSRCSGLTSLDVTRFDTSAANNLSSMFSGCSKLTSLDVSGFNTSAANNLSGMFGGCSGLTSLDVSEFNTSAATTLRSMFTGCSGLTSLDVSGFNTSTANNLGYMFDGCSKLTSLDVSGFNTSAVTDLSHMFSGCSKLTSLDVSGFDTSDANNLAYMFSGCSGLTSLDVSGFNVTKVNATANQSGVNFLLGVKLVKANYDALLDAWSKQALTIPGVTFNFGTSQYSKAPSAGATGRGILTGAPNNWNITDGGPI